MAAKLRILSIGNKKRHQKATIFKFFAIIIHDVNTSATDNSKAFAAVFTSETVGIWHE